MVIGKKFIWSHFPKTGGCSTRAMFDIVHHLVLESSNKPTVTHSRFDEIDIAKNSKERILNIRRLPCYLISYAFDQQNNANIPFDRELLMEKGMLKHFYKGKITPFRVDDGLDDFMCGRVDHWLRTEYLAKDFINVISKFGHISKTHKEKIYNVRHNDGIYNKNIEYFTPEEIARLYEMCPLWASIERKVYKPKITIGTGWVGDDYNKLGNFTSNFNKKYADRYGYKFVSFNKPFVKPELKYHKYLQKFHLVLRHLDECDWFVWIDADAAFLRRAKPIETIINDKYYLIMQSDIIPPSWPNTGMMIVKSCDKSREFFNNALDISLLEITKFANKHNHPVLWDQTATYVVFKNPYFKNGVKVLKYGELWSQPYHYEDYRDIIAVHCTDGTLRTLGKKEIKAESKIDVLRGVFEGKIMM